MANILAVGTAAASSTAITVVANTPQTIFLTSTSGTVVPDRAQVAIELQAASGVYMQVDELTNKRQALILDGPGTYRATRIETGASCGVDLNPT